MCDLDFADRLNDSGFTLSVEEKAGLQAAMLQRKLEENFSVFQFCLLFEQHFPFSGYM